MRVHSSDMSHDEAAHELERRFELLAGLAFVIGFLHWMLYHAAF